MNSDKVRHESIDAYIATFPDAIQAILQTLRATIHAAAPDAVEKISYQMPTFALHGNLIYFAAWKKHIGLYPVSGAVWKTFADELAPYDVDKGSIRFPIDQPLPLDLISRIVTVRVAESIAEAQEKSKKTG